LIGVAGVLEVEFGIALVGSFSSRIKASVHSVMMASAGINPSPVRSGPSPDGLAGSGWRRGSLGFA